MSHSNRPPVRKLAPLTTWSISLRYIGSRASHCRTVLQNEPEMNQKASPKMRSIMEHSAGLPLYSKVFEKLLWKPSKDASQRSSWNWMSLPIYQDLVGTFIFNCSPNWMLLFRMMINTCRKNSDICYYYYFFIIYIIYSTTTHFIYVNLLLILAQFPIQILWTRCLPEPVP